MRPTFFVIGAARAGTTTLFDALSRHPDVFCCPVKEPHFFSADIGRDPATIAAARRDGRLVRADHGNGAPAPRVGLTLDEGDYLALFARAQGRTACGEASTDYLPSRVAPASVRAFAPDARIVVMLRNPVDRAWSHYRMAEQNGRAAPPFAEIVAADRAAIRAQAGVPMTGCFGRGLYAPQLSRWFGSFPREQILVVLFDALVADPAGTLARVLAHVGAAPAAMPAAPVPQLNRTRQLRHAWLNRALSATGSRDRILRLTPAPLRRLGARIVFRDQAAPALADHERARLLPLFADDIRATAALIGADLSAWLNPADTPAVVPHHGRAGRMAAG